jgi:peptidyl-prolyl cis-trans isomerase C
MRTTRLAAAAAVAAFSYAVAAGPIAHAQNSPTPAPAHPAAAAPAAAAPAAAATAPAPPPDPVVARVGNDEVHASEVQEAMSSVPAEYRQLPPQVLFPMLLDQLVDRHAITAMALKQGLENDPQVKAAMQRAADNALDNAVVGRAVRPLVTEDAIKARYEATYANKPGEEEVHARHILVDSEDKAKQLIKQLDAGADFATLAKANSTDPGAAQGGDLGWFKKGDMLPEFSAVAFALKPGEISQTPVHTRYGWHVIKVEERRAAPQPTLEQAHDQLRQQIIQEAVQKVVKEARDSVKVEKFNLDGTPIKPSPVIPAAPGASPAANPAPTPAPAK